MKNKIVLVVLAYAVIIHGQFNNYDDAVKKLKDAARETFWKPNQSLLLQKFDTSKFDQFMSDLNSYLDKNGYNSKAIQQSTKFINDAYLNLVAGLKLFSGRMSQDRTLIMENDAENDKKAYNLILNFNTSVLAPLNNARDLLVEANKSSKSKAIPANNLLLELINVLFAAGTKAVDEFKTFPGDINELPKTASLRWKKLYSGLYATPPVGGKDVNFGQLLTVIAKPFPF